MNIIHHTPTRPAEFPPRSFVLYGEAKIGKSDLVAHFPKPLFFNLEDGLSNIAGDQVNGLATPQDLQAALDDAAQDLRTGKLAHRTVILDGLTTFVTAASLRSKSKDGRKVAKEMVTLFIPILDTFYSLPLVRAVTLHARLNEYEKEIEIEGRRRAIVVHTAEPDVSPRLRTYLTGVADAIGYCHTLNNVPVVDWLPTDMPTEKILAGNRLGLPRQMPLNYAALAAALTLPAGAPKAGSNGHGQVMLKRDFKAEWNEFYKANHVTEAQLHQALGTTKVSEWIAADPGRTLELAMQAVKKVVEVPF